MEMEARDNVALRHIVELFPRILVEGLETNVANPIPLQDLLPDNTDLLLPISRLIGNLFRSYFF